MPTTSPRINTVLDPALYQTVERLARAEGISLSQKVRDLIRESVERIEESGWEAKVRLRRHLPRRWGPAH
ncbi:MAG TPA: ribbon-helix-helix protein, CopG family [Candidatus Methylomirabilis sp.]